MTDIAKGSLTAAHADEFVTAWADADELTWEECRAIGVEDEVCADVQSVLLVAGCVTVSERERLIGRGYPENFVSSLFGHDGWRAAGAKTANSCAGAGAVRKGLYRILLDRLGDGESRDGAALAICRHYLSADEASRRELASALDSLVKSEVAPSPFLVHLTRVINGDEFSLSSSEMTQPQWAGVSIDEYGGEYRFSFLREDGELLAAVPGRAAEDGSIPDMDGISLVSMAAGESADNLFITGFLGDLNLRIVGRPRSISFSIAALLRARKELPSVLLDGVSEFVYQDDAPGVHSFANQVFFSVGGYSDLVHELGHHWEFFIGPKVGRSLVKLFKSISWRGVSRRRHVRGYAELQEFMNIDTAEGLRKDFDVDDFVSPYSLSNPNEDLAETMRGYVVSGSAFREGARARMAGGNFEFAAKYLFVKHLMPFEGREYQLDDGAPPLTIEEVRQAYEAATDTSATGTGTYRVILDIERLAGPRD